METIFWCISSHTMEQSQASVTTMTMTTTAPTSRKATKRNANRQKKSYRAHRGAPRYHIQGVLVAHCHRCKITHPMGQHLPSITVGLTQPATTELTRYSVPTMPSLDQPEQETTQILPDKNPDSREFLGNAPPAFTTTRQQSPNLNQVSFHLSTQWEKGTQPTEIQKRFKRNSGRRRRKDGSRIYRGPRPINDRPTN